MNNNARYYINLGKIKDSYYRLYYVPGHENYLSSPADIEITDKILIKNTLKIDNSFEDGIPIGMPLIPLMEFELDLKILTDNDLRLSIIRGCSTNLSATGTIGNVRSESIKIPNNWYLLTAAADDWEYVTIYNNCIFDGVQEIVPIQLPANDGKFKVKVYGLLQQALKSISVESLITGGDPYTYEQTILQYTYGLISARIFNGKFLTYERPVAGAELKFGINTLEDIFDAIEIALGVVSRAFKRHSTYVVSLTKDNLTFYKQDYTSYTGQVGDPLTGFSDIKLITHIYDINLNLVGGLLVDSKSEGSWVKFKNLYNLLAALCENFLYKADIKYDYSSGDRARIYLMRILDYTYMQPDSIAEVIDSTIISYKPKESEPIKRSVSHIVNATELDENEFQYLSEDATEDNASFETELIINNQIVNPVEVWGSGYNLDGAGKLNGLITDFTTIQTMYYTIDTNTIARIHDYTTFELGNSVSVTSDSIISDPNYGIENVDFRLLTPLLRGWILVRMRKSGMGYTWAKATFKLLNKAMFLEIETDLLDNRYLGAICDVDLSDLIPYGIPANFDIDLRNGIITEISTDLRIATITIMLRGDRL